VVLYDRYYFDFINDSKRSNITLPKGLTKGAYALIMNPNFNFFLYADPDTILKRKQELDKDTIVQLTSDYKELFKHLDKANGARFIAIENVILDETIRTIINYTTLQK
jgi:thymidylate kinase